MEEQGVRGSIHQPPPMKTRQYPIKRDEDGKSARQRAFRLFQRGMRPASVAPRVGISPRTACRYFESWKRLPKNPEGKHYAMKRILKDPDLRLLIANDVASQLNVSVKWILGRFEKPWAAKQLVTGEWRNWVSEEKKEKRKWRRLQVAGHIMDLYEAEGVPLKQIMAELGKLKAEASSHK